MSWSKVYSISYDTDNYPYKTILKNECSIATIDIQPHLYYSIVKASLSNTSYITSIAVFQMRTALDVLVLRSVFWINLDSVFEVRNPQQCFRFRELFIASDVYLSISRDIKLSLQICEILAFLVCVRSLSLI